MGRLEGKIAIITGAARGQGECEARMFAAEGAKVLVTDVLDEIGRETAASIGAAAAYVSLDVTSAAGWQHAVDECERRLGTPNVLVNNAGIMLPGTLLECDEETFRNILDINLTGAFLGIKAVAPRMITGGGGSIINISSVAALVARPGYTAYGTSKWGLRGLTKYAAMELGQHSIRVNSIHPGAVATQMTLPDLSPAAVEERNSLLTHLPIPRWAHPDEIARLALFLASDDSSYSTGSEFVADGGRSAGSV